MALKTYTLTLIDPAEAIDVAPVFSDSVAFEAYLRANRRLGKLADNAILSTGYRCWAAARREGKTDAAWDEFQSRIGDIEIEAEADLDDDEYSLDDADGIAGKSTPAGV